MESARKLPRGQGGGKWSGQRGPSVHSVDTGRSELLGEAGAWGEWQEMLREEADMDSLQGNGESWKSPKQEWQGQTER